MVRLSEASLGGLPAGTALPPRPRPEPGIVHLGVGAFHRAHQALYTEEALAVEPGAWGVVGVSLRRPDMRDALAPQDFLYTAVERDAAGERRRIVGVLRDILVAPEDPAAVVARVAARETRIVTLTVTEKGYYHDPATGLLRPDDPDIQHDIRDPGRPRTAIGVLVRGLDRRRRAGTAPPTVISCDNLPDNGATLAGIVSAFASSIDDGLAAWIERHVAFPSTMVDRIVPATTPEDADRNATLLGVEDASPVLFEPFRQWVIEDRFGGPRPRWEAAGAQFVPDVRPFEHMKLRLLNGSHSAIAYLGYLAGHEYVHQAMADPPFRTFVERLMAREAGRTLEALPGVDLAAYQEALIARFANPALRHRTWQIAMDGSQKLPQRLLGTARDLIAADRPIDHVALAVAAWMRYAAGIDERGRRIEVSDPMADILRAVGSRAGDDPIALARGMLGLRAIFDPGLADDPRFSGPVVDAAKTLRAQGARGAVARLVDTVSM